LIASECKKRNAGFILTDLDEDEHFTYLETADAVMILFKKEKVSPKAGQYHRT
jgi:hypothetical protein